ncbi:helix-turn-helix domain-containing protein [Streptomyces sp. NPDC049744]|uniref:TetR/AcrR family transcriptional regulator n=1 Tax=Streptomyces sp. NPDC049744 TaxID=3154359 RepID=UPI0034288CAD
MTDKRRHQIRLDISRGAARLFWQQGFAATSGEQIAELAGLSSRTIWRHFRSKGSCVEPVVEAGVEWFVVLLRRWPRQMSLKDHIAAELSAMQQSGSDPWMIADFISATQMIVLADREPAIRTAWLMACHRVEIELALVAAERLRCPKDDTRARLLAAVATAVLRLANEEIGRDLVAGWSPKDMRDVSQRMASVVSGVAVGRLGEAVSI